MQSRVLLSVLMSRLPDVTANTFMQMHSEKLKEKLKHAYSLNKETRMS
jgi:hypothetical protein